MTFTLSIYEIMVGIACSFVAGKMLIQQKESQVRRLQAKLRSLIWEENFHTKIRNCHEERVLFGMRAFSISFALLSLGLGLVSLSLLFEYQPLKQYLVLLGSCILVAISFSSLSFFNSLHKAKNIDRLKKKLSKKKNRLLARLDRLAA